MWIQDIVKDKTFVDVGGLWHTLERVTEASLAGASEVTMIDGMKESSRWWDKFDKRCKEKGVVCKNKISVTYDLNDADFIITNYMPRRGKNFVIDKEKYKKYYELQVDNKAINTVYRKVR